METITILSKLKNAYRTIGQLLFTKGYIWPTCLIVSLIFLIILIKIGNNWNEESHRNVSINIEDVGHLGEPSCSVKLYMNYTYDTSSRDSVGCYTYIYHPYYEHSPYLFGKSLFDNTDGRDRYNEEYAPLNEYCPFAVDQISTVFKSTITTSSDLYNLNPKSRENWYCNENAIAWVRNDIQDNVEKSNMWSYLKRWKSKYKEGCYCVLVNNVNMCYENNYLRWLANKDVSKLEFRLNLNTNRIKCDTLFINFYGSYSLNSITVEPDAKTYSSFAYVDSAKIAQIQQMGLEFSIFFPGVEKFQNTRMNWLLAIVIPVLLSLIGSIVKSIVTLKRKL